MNEKKFDVNFPQMPPPHNIDAEDSLIASILLDSNILLDILDIVSFEDFYSSKNRIIFKSMMEMSKANIPIDLVTLTDQLIKDKVLEQIGGAAYLAKIIDTVPLAINAPHYAKIIYEKSALRQLIDVSNNLVRNCHLEHRTIQENIDYAEKKIFDISSKNFRHPYTHVKEIINENIDTIELRRENDNTVTGVSSGYADIDFITAGFQPANLIILAGRPGMGKTALALNMLLNITTDKNQAALMFSLEMSEAELGMRMLSSEAKIDSKRLRTGMIGKVHMQQLMEAAGNICEQSIFIDDSADLSMLEIRTKARRLKLSHDISIIFIDYLQLIKTRAAAERRDIAIAEITRSLKILAKELDIPIVALSQLNRKLEERPDKHPKLADLRDSGSIEQDADIVAFIYRDELYNNETRHKGVAEVNIAKQRNGILGTVRLTFKDKYTRFENFNTEIR